MDELHRVAALLDRRLSGPDKDAAVSAIVASDESQVLLADAARDAKRFGISAEGRGERDA